jgi:hypothetical protein
MTMRISASELDRYSAAVTAQQEAAYRFVQGALRSYWSLNGGALSWEDMASFAEQVLVSCSEQFGAQASSIACEAYDATIEQLGIRAPQAQPAEPMTRQGAAGAVSSAREASGGDFARFAERLSVKAHGSVGRSANLTTISNAERDYSKGVRYARVPTGRETCGFCLMLASRGFDYRSRQSAGYTGGAFNRFHDRCDCRVVAGDSSTTVDGYDPDWLYEAYLDARKTVDPEAIRNEMAGAGSDEVNKRVTDSVCDEIEKRSRGWSWDGIVAETPKSEYSKFTDALAAHGLATSITDREGAPLRMNGLTWGMGDSTGGGSVADSIAALRQERRDGGTKTDGHYVLLVDGIADAERAAIAALREGETAILIDPNAKDRDTGMTPMRRITR